MTSCDHKQYLASRSVVFLELTNRCNMNCLFCPNHKMTRPRGDMPFSLAKSVLNQLSEGDFRGSVITSLMGEPLLHPEFLPIVNHGAGVGLRMNVITNFVCVPEKNWGSGLADMMKEEPLAHLMRMEELGRLVHPLWQKCRGRVLLANKPFRIEKPIGAANGFFQCAHRAGERLGGMRNTLMRH